MPKDRVTQLHQGYGFVEFLGEEDADYAIKIMNMIKLYGKPIRVNKASAHQKNLDVGANIFIGNLDPEVDEKLLYDTFSAFGVILQTPKIMRDPETGNSKGFAFINFASFEASDAAMDAMNGQYLCNRPISVSYAFKKDSKGERHGSAAERLLAAQNPLSHADRPHQLFADAPIPMMPMIPNPPMIVPPPIPNPPMPMQMQGHFPAPPMAPPRELLSFKTLFDLLIFFLFLQLCLLNHHLGLLLFHPHHLLKLISKNLSVFLVKLINFDLVENLRKFISNLCLFFRKNFPLH